MFDKLLWSHGKAREVYYMPCQKVVIAKWRFLAYTTLFSWFFLRFGRLEQRIVESAGYTSPFAALDSVFVHMDDATFFEYRAYGIDVRETFEYSKEYRNEHPCKYRNDEGGLNDIDHPEDWINLNIRTTQS